MVYMPWNIDDLEKDLLVGSTLVEGSTLSEEEAHSVLKGRTVQGHSLESHKELHNYRSAVVWLMEQLSANPFLSADLIQTFHRRLFYGFKDVSSEWKESQNFTYLSSGKRFNYLSPSLVKKEIGEWVAHFNKEVKDKEQAALCLEAAKLYYHFQYIHPFTDGNGRIGRVLLAYWLHWKSGLSLRFYLKDKVEHLNALEQANSDSFQELADFFFKRVEGNK
jgi:Fic family protein